MSYRALLRLDAVGNLLLAASLARLAERMLGLAVVLDALAQFRSPQLAGWVACAAITPGLLVSPLAGALLDRIGAARAVALDLACSAGCILLLGLLCLGRADSAGSLLILVALYSLGHPLSAAGVRTLLPGLVPPAALGRANALDTSIHAAVDVCGPALAGALFGFTGAAVTFLAIAACYAAAGVALLPAMRRRPRALPAWRGGLLADAMAGVAHVLRHRSLRMLSLAYALYQMAWGILMVAVPVFVTRIAGGGARGDLLVGALWAVCGIAGGVGALLAGRHGAPGRERAMMALGMLLTPLAIYPLSVSFGLPGLCLGLALVGFLAGPVDVGVLTLRQRRTDPGWLGRVMAVSIGLNLSGAPIGAALGGMLLTWSVPAAFAVAAVACLAGAVATRWLPKR
ncbi:MAG TPA: MFS transporter [Acetobacteraceae bacterium]|nr:MFS transporter [Acetobacteraceae bacterium]